LFCCPIMTISKYIESYFPSLSVADYIRDNDDLPLYVQALLFEQQVPIDISTERTNRGEAQLPRLVGIYDLRNEEIDI
ncbi:MAG: hypothetical protein KC463_07380, partial [Streptococcus sp.]|nr:hypothetical protein [Streptococcus sp.]